MTSVRIQQLRNIIFQVSDNAWKRQTGTQSDRRVADENDMEALGKLCNALEEALAALEREAQTGG